VIHEQIIATIRRCRERPLWRSVRRAGLSIGSAGTARRPFPTGQRVPETAISDSSNSFPPRVDDFGVFPIVPIQDQILANGVVERVFNDFFEWLAQIENAIVAALLPQRTDQAVFPRLGRGVAFESCQMVKHALNL